MNYIILAIMLFVCSCSMFSNKNIFDRKEDCVERFIKQGAKPLEADQICTHIYDRK